jgi:hypothetical protein
MPAIRKLPNSAYVLPSNPPAFLKLASSTSGDAGSEKDGFDNALLNLLTALESIPKAGTAADKLLTDAYTASEVLRAIDGADISQQIAAALQLVTTDYDTLDAAFTLLSLTPGSLAGGGIMAPPTGPTGPGVGGTIKDVGSILSLLAGAGGGGGSGAGIGGAALAGLLGPGLTAALAGIAAGVGIPLLILQIMGVNLWGPSAAQIKTDQELTDPNMKATLAQLEQIDSDFTFLVTAQRPFSPADSQRWIEAQGRSGFYTTSLIDTMCAAAVNLAHKAHLDGYAPYFQELCADIKQLIPLWQARVKAGG